MITTLTSNETGANSLIDINANFADLDTTKADSTAVQPKTFITVGTSNADYITDGTADDVQIQAAIDAVSAAGGGIVFIKAGTYNTTSTIHDKSNISLVGEGSQKTIIKGAATTYTMLNTVRSGTTSTLFNNISLKDMTFVSQSDAIIEINNTNNFHASGLEIYYTVTTPVSECFNLQYCQNVNIVDNYLHNITGNGIQVNAVTNFNIANNIIDAIVATDTDGIDIDTDFMLTKTFVSSFGTVTGNVIKNSVNGIRVENGHNFAITGNTIDTCTGSGIYLNTSDSLTLKYVNVTGNTISRCVAEGIAVIGNAANDMSGISLLQNNINNCGTSGGGVTAGITINAENIKISGNNIVNCGKNDASGGGVVLYKKSNALVSDNFISDSYFGIRVWNGSAAEVYTNISILNNKMFNNGTDYVDAITQAGVFLVTENTTGMGVGIASSVASARLDVTSTTLGFLPPRMTTTQKAAISSPAEGLQVYDLTLHKMCVYTGAAWQTITSA